MRDLAAVGGARLRLWCALSCVLLFLVFDHAQAQPVPSDVANRVARSVVEITASRCSDGPNRTGTGFAFKHPAQIVTAHHVVAGCDAFQVFFERAPGSPTLGATVTKVLPHSDLALLKVVGPPSIPALSLRLRPINPNALLVAIGYSLQQPTLSNLDVGISIGSAVLSSFLPTPLQAELKAKTRIDLDSRIIRFKSHLEPGMSGGPIADSAGNVVAIVAGGLKNGTVPASWGWPASLLTSLIESNIPVVSLVEAPATLFTSTKGTTPGRTQTCGSLAFTYTGTLRYGEIWPTADNPQVIKDVATISTLSQQEIDRLKFDIWRHVDSGATVAVPADIQLAEAGQRCVARSRSRKFEQIVQGEVAISPQQVQFMTQRFEQETVSQYSGYVWQRDFYLTAPGPTTRSDGLVVNRKGVYGVSLTQPKAAHVSETLMARGGSVVGVAAINHDYGPQYQPCFATPKSQACMQVRAEIMEFIHFVLAVQLSTYPVY